MAEHTQPTLVEYLAQVPDFRRREGRRYPLPTLLVMIIRAILSGQYGYREIARFLKANRDELVAHLGLKRKRMPSHVTIRTVLMKLDFEALNEAFQHWAQTHLQVASGDWVSVDAKAIGSTATDYDNAYQDFCVFGERLRPRARHRPGDGTLPQQRHQRGASDPDADHGDG